MEQIKNILHAIQRGETVHPAEMALAQAEVAYMEKLLHTLNRGATTQKQAVEAHN